MSRNARGRDPYVIHKERVELSGGNIALRIVGVCLAVVVAVFAFGRGISGMLSVETGWQSITPNNPTTGITGDFTLGYNIGASNQPAMAELKAVSVTYTEAIDHAYRVMSNVPMEHYTNLHTLNTHPNEAVSVDALLYAALETVEAAGSRYPYLAPVFEQYYSLCAGQTDEEAEKYDPARNAEAAEFAAEVAVFAADPAMVQLTLLPEHQVRLDVAEEYMRFAAENGVESFVDFGILTNAFLCDAAADALAAAGYTNGYLASFDGYVRALCSDSLSVHLLTQEAGAVRSLGAASYVGPAAVAVCRSFPVSAQDSVNYHVYANGSVAVPYMSIDGNMHANLDSLITMDTQGSAAALALRTVAALTACEWNPEILSDLSWIAIRNSTPEIHGNGFRING